VLGEDAQANSGLLSSGNVDQAKNPAMHVTADDRQLAEILVKGNQDSTFAVRTGKNLLVAGIFRPIPGPYDLMAPSFQLPARLAPDAGVEQ